LHGVLGLISLKKHFLRYYGPKAFETGGTQGIRVDVDCFSSVNVLEHPHRCVLYVVFHHHSVVLARVYVVTGMLENAARTISTFYGVFYVILTHGREVLLVQSSLRLQLSFAMGKTTALVFSYVLALLAAQPVLTEFGFNLEFPVLDLVITDRQIFLVHLR